MKLFVGLDVSLEKTAIFVISEHGKIVKEAQVASEPEALLRWIGDQDGVIAAIGLEAGPLSQWLHRGLAGVGQTVVLMETRQVKGALKAMPIKTDRRDAEGIARLLHLGWFGPVHCKSVSAQEVRAVLSARKAVQQRFITLEMSLRGLLRNFGLKVGTISRGRFEQRIRELAAGNAMLEAATEPMLRARSALRRELAGLERHVRQLAQEDPVFLRLMSMPGIGAVVALTYRSAVDDPTRFTSSKKVGPWVGLAPSRNQSGERDIFGGITKAGDVNLRRALCQAATVMMHRGRASWLRTWAAKIARRRGPKRAMVALDVSSREVVHPKRVRLQSPNSSRGPCRMNNPHQGARLTVYSREQIVARLSAGQKAAEVAAAFGVSLRTVRKWLARFRAGGCAALSNRASAPVRVAGRLPDRLVALALHLRRELRLTGAEIAVKLGLARSTVARWLARAGMGRLAQIDPPEPVRRYQRARAGELIHLDIKKLGRFDRPGHRVTGTRRGCRNRGAGWDFVHVAVDDATRLAYVEVLADERRDTTTAFLLRALRWFREHGIRAERVMTDNGSAYRSRRFAKALRWLGIRHIFTRPYTPKTNGKASPSQRPRTGGGTLLDIQTLLREWAYGLFHPTSDARNADLTRWLDWFNRSRPHSALNGVPPLARVNDLLRTHT